VDGDRLAAGQTGAVPSVSDEDRRLMRRQARALFEQETDDAPGDGALEARRMDADRWRAVHGIDPLLPWWATKTEPELHRRARALGLLD
jgi:hypothetical protein